MDLQIKRRLTDTDVQNAIFPTDIQDYYTSAEYYNSLSDSHTMSKLILNKLPLLTIIYN